MVDGLAERLNGGAGTAEEWLRLIRARAVLGDKPAAEMALMTARQRLAGDSDAMAALQSIARELMLEARP
jgi:cytochrome c-type biogenesis protein CcmH